MEKDFKICRGKKKRIKSIALIAKKESSDDEASTSESDDEEYAMAVRNFKKFFKKKVNLLGNQEKKRSHFDKGMRRKGTLIGDCLKPPRNKDQKAFIGGSWSDSENDAEDKTNDETCLMAQSSNENKILKTKRDLLEKEILELNEKIKKLERSKEIEIACKSCEELKLENARLMETQVKFDTSANSTREMLDNQKSSSCKVGLGFDSNKASTSGTKPITFVGSSAKKATDGSIIKVHGPPCLDL
nr:zf-CCHC domain-containing protein/UBN2 domain-containing protein [Tanacetum cinerariifolium]